MHTRSNDFWVKRRGFVDLDGPFFVLVFEIIWVGYVEVAGLGLEIWWNTRVGVFVLLNDEWIWEGIDLYVISFWFDFVCENCMLVFTFSSSLLDQL